MTFNINDNQINILLEIVGFFLVTIDLYGKERLEGITKKIQIFLQQSSLFFPTTIKFILKLFHKVKDFFGRINRFFIDLFKFLNQYEDNKPEIGLKQYLLNAFFLLLHFALLFFILELLDPYLENLNPFLDFFIRLSGFYLLFIFYLLVFSIILLILFNFFIVIRFFLLIIYYSLRAINKILTKTKLFGIMVYIGTLLFLISKTREFFSIK